MEIDRAYYGPTDLHVARDFELLARLHSEIEAENGKADTAYREALAIYRRHYDARHPEVLRVQNGMASNLRRMRRFAESESLHRDVLAAYRELHPQGHPDVATAAYNLALVLDRQSRYAEAESLMLEALDIRKRMLGENTLPTVELLNDLGAARVQAGDTAGGVEALREASERGRVGLGLDHPSTLSALGNLGLVLTRQSKYVEAESALRAVVAGRRLSRSEQPGLSRALTSLGTLLRDLKRYREADSAYREAAYLARLNLEARKNLLAGALSGLGTSKLRQQQVTDAESLFQQAVGLRRSYLDSAAVTRLWDERQYGNVLIKLGKFAAAESVLVPSFRASTGTSAAAVHREIAVLLVTLYRSSGQAAEARKYVPDTTVAHRTP
jgi:tetratricopeptide (TPR) repeat protein